MEIFGDIWRFGDNVNMSMSLCCLAATPAGPDRIGLHFVSLATFILPDPNKINKRHVSMMKKTCVMNWYEMSIKKALFHLLCLVKCSCDFVYWRMAVNILQMCQALAFRSCSSPQCGSNCSHHKRSHVNRFCIMLHVFYMIMLHDLVHGILAWFFISSRFKSLRCSGQQLWHCLCRLKKLGPLLVSPRRFKTIQDHSRHSQLWCGWNFSYLHLGSCRN